MNHNLGIGIVGVGGVGGYAHIPAYMQRGLHISAICDQDENILLETAKKFQIPFYTTRFDELIRHPQVDIVDIATPPATHLPMLESMDGIDKYILMQKPLCCTYHEYVRLKDVLKSRKLRLNMTGRYVSAWVKIKQLLSENTIGKPLICTINNRDWWDRQPGRWDHSIAGYIIYEMAIHHLDLCLFWFGTPKSVTARGGYNPKQKMHQMNWVSIILEYEHGLVVQLVENWSMPEYSFAQGHPFEEILITGEDGAIRANSEKVEVSRVHANNLQVWHHPRPGQVLTSEVLQHNWFIDSFGCAMEDYISDIRAGREHSEDTHHTVALTSLTLQVERAAQQSSWVPCDIL